MKSQPPVTARAVSRGEQTANLPEEFDPKVCDLAWAIRDLLRPLLRGAGFLDWYGRPGPSVAEWSVAMPVAISHGGALHPVCEALPRLGREVLLPGTRMLVVGGTLGHIGWPPASVVLEAGAGLLAGRRIEFLIDPDPRPLGRLAALCAALVVCADEPLLGDFATLARFEVDAGRLIASSGLAKAARPLGRGASLGLVP